MILASDPVLDRMPSLAFFVMVPTFTSSDELINENPERLFLR